MLITTSLQFAIWVGLCTKGIYNLNNEYFFNKDQEHGHDHGRIGGPSHSLCATGGIISFVSAHHTNGKSKDQGADQGRIKIQKSDLLKCVLNKSGEAGLLVQIDVEE